MLDLTDVKEIKTCAVVAWLPLPGFSNKEKYEEFETTKEAEEYRASLAEDTHSRILWGVYLRYEDGFSSWLMDCESQDIAETVVAGLRLLLKREQCCGDAACYNESSGVPCAAEKFESRKEEAE